MTIEQETDHASRVERFTSRWQVPYLKALAKSYLLQLQDVEDAAFEVILERSLDNATGVVLNFLGAIVGQPRTSSDDERYRTAIRARIAINLSDGSPEDIIRVVRLILVNGEDFRIIEEPPAQLRVRVFSPLVSTSHDLLLSLVDLADCAGVRLVIDWSSNLTPSQAFRLGDTVSGGVGLGLGSTVGTAQPGMLMCSVGDR